MPQLHLLCWDDERRLSEHPSRREREPDACAENSQLHLLVEPSKFGSEPPLNRPDAGGCRDGQPGPALHRAPRICQNRERIGGRKGNGRRGVQPCDG